MSSKKMYDQMLQMMMQQINAQNQRINTPSPYETQMSGEANDITNFLNSRDYRNIPASLGGSIDLMPLADAQKLRQMTRGSMNTGQGMINPQILSSQRELDDNQFAQDYGNAFEQRVGDLSNKRDALLGGLQGQYNTRIGQNQGTFQDMGGYLQGVLNRPKGFWSQMLPGLIQGGISAATHFI